MKSKFPKSFILLILVVAIISAMLVSAHANTGTAVFGSISELSSGNGTNYSPTDCSSEYGTVSQGTTNYFTDSFGSTSGYTESTVFSGSTTFREESTETDLSDLTIKELFALLEESLDNDIAEAEENGGNVEAITKVAAEIKQEISEIKQMEKVYYVLRLHDLPEFINESYKREGITMSERTQEIIKAIKRNSPVPFIFRTTLFIPEAVPVGEFISGTISMYSPNGFPDDFKIDESNFKISGNGKVVLSDFVIENHHSENISCYFKLTGTYPGTVSINVEDGCVYDNYGFSNIGSINKYIDIKLFNTKGEKAHDRMSDPELYFTILIAPIWYIFNSIKNLFISIFIPDIPSPLNTLTVQFWRSGCSTWAVELFSLLRNIHIH